MPFLTEKYQGYIVMSTMAAATIFHDQMKINPNHNFCIFPAHTYTHFMILPSF